MKIKETNPEYYFKIKNNINKIYRRKIMISFLLIIILTVYSISLLYYGMVLQKIQVGAKLQQIFFDGAVTKLNIIPNYFNSLFSNPDKFSIDLNFKDIQKGIPYLRRRKFPKMLSIVKKLGDKDDITIIKNILKLHGNFARDFLKFYKQLKKEHPREIWPK